MLNPHTPSQNKAVPARLISITKARAAYTVDVDVVFANNFNCLCSTNFIYFL